MKGVFMQTSRNWAKFGMLALSAALISGCASIGQVREQVANSKKAVVVYVHPDEVVAQKIGTTIFNNKDLAVTPSNLSVREVIEATVAHELREHFANAEINTSSSLKLQFTPIKGYHKNSWKFKEKQISPTLKSMGYDILILVDSSGVYDMYVAQSTPGGVGYFLRDFAGMGEPVMKAGLLMVVIDLETGSDLGRGVAIDHVKPIDIASFPRTEDKFRAFLTNKRVDELRAHLETSCAMLISKLTETTEAN